MPKKPKKMGLQRLFHGISRLSSYAQWGANTVQSYKVN